MSFDKPVSTPAEDIRSRAPVFPVEVKLHAVRRWRAYQPRRYQDPEPTISWTDECPCGVKIPCEKHGDLSFNVRYLNPADPKYAAALKEAGIPHYIPTPDELTRAEPTDLPCTSLFYVKKPAQPTDPDQPLPAKRLDLNAR